MIDLGLPPFVKRVIKEAEAKNAQALIFKINTFGGRLDAAVQIKDHILNSSVKTIAFIDKRAISAGALISLSADHIIMSNNATIGAATPVDAKGTKLTEKQVSYMRAEMRATAEKNNRSVQIAEAMVDENIEIKDIIEKGKLLTLTTEEALKHKIADMQAKNIKDIIEKLELSPGTIIHTSLNWAEKFVRFISHPIMSSLLLSIAFLGILFEIRSPGWGVAGTVGILALLLFFGSHFIVQLASWGEILIFVIGLMLIIAEIFVIPGFGIAGILGMIAILASLIMSFLGYFPSQADLVNSLIAVISALIFSMVLSLAIFRKLPRFNFFNRLVLSTGQFKDLEIHSSSETGESYLGLEGVTLSDLRPSGTARIRAKKIDVISEGEYIPQNSRVKIIKVEGNRCIVEKI